MTGYYPDFIVSPGSQGNTVAARLLSFVPDVVFLEGEQAWGINPLADDSLVYTYGPEHPILEGKYRREN